MEKSLKQQKRNDTLSVGGTCKTTDKFSSEIIETKKKWQYFSSNERKQPRILYPAKLEIKGNSRHSQVKEIKKIYLQQTILK